YSVWSVAWSPDGRRLASGAVFSDTVARVWDAATGRKLTELRGHTFGITSVAFAPDGRTLATGSQDGTFRLWDAATGAPLRTFEGAGAWPRSPVVFSLDGRSLVTGGAALRIRDVGGRQAPRALADGWDPVPKSFVGPDRLLAWIGDKGLVE